MMTLKVTEKQSYALSSDSICFKIFRLKVLIFLLLLLLLLFLNKTSILVFAELAIFHSI